MPVIINERTQYVDIGGKPLAGGNVFIGVANQDPKLNLEPIFADRGLSVPLANPQLLNSRGQTENKIYVAGRYSFKLEDSEGAQVEQDLDKGAAESAQGTTGLLNVAGINTITAEADPTLAAYLDKAQFALTLVNEPTGATTLNIDGVGAVPIKNKGIDITPNQLPANGIIIVAFNIIGPVFELISGGGDELRPRQGASVASSAQPNIWAGDGNTLHITGPNQINTFTDAPRIGAKVTLIFDAALRLKDGLGITLQGGADILTAPGDRFEVYADALDAFSGIFTRNVPPSSFAKQLLHVEDHKSSGTSGGTFTQGAYRLRDLNTVITNQIEGSSLSASVVSVPAGIYYIEASAPAFQVNDHKIKLQDNTAVVDLKIGSSERASAADDSVTRSFVSGQFSVSVTTNLRILHRCQLTKGTEGFGVATSFGDTEVFTVFKIWRIGA